jgi:hypothetical protein
VAARAQAAAAYVVYGLVYLGGAWVQMTPERRSAGGPIPWWAFFVAGALLVVVLPPLVLRGPRWIPVVLGALVGVKALALWWRAATDARAGGPIAFHACFAAIATATCVLLLRASAAAPRRA